MTDSSIPLIIGVTGHRMLADPTALAAVVARELRQLTERFADTPIVLLSPLAEGADRLVAEVALREPGARLIVPLPMPLEQYERDFATESSRQQFRALLARASRVTVVGIDGAPVDEAQRKLAYARVGAYVAEQSQVLVALWDGEPSRGLGGTAEVVAWELAGAAPDALRPPGSAPTSLDGPKGGYVLHIHAMTGQVRRLPEQRAAGATGALARIDDFNRAARRLSAREPERVAQSRRWLMGDQLPTDDPGLERIADLHATADALSGTYKRKHATAFNVIYGFFVAAILLFALIDWRQELIWLYVVIFPVVLGMHVWTKRRQIEDRALDCRALAEGLRVLAFWRVCGIGQRVSDNYLSKHGEALSWIRRSIANLELTVPPRAGDRRPDGVALAERWWIDAQLRFFASRLTKVRRLDVRLGRLSATAFGLTFLVAVAYALALVGIEHNATVGRWFARGAGMDVAASSDAIADAAGKVFQVAMGFLGALGVASEAIRAKKDLDGQARRYALAEGLFARARQRLSDPHCHRQELLANLGREALIENGEWLWAQRTLSGQMLRG